MADVPGLLVPGNIDLHARPVVRNRDGSISTVRSMSFGEDGREVLVPTVAADGSRILGEREAIEQYHRTGQHLGMFATPEAATSYAQQLHREQEREYAPMADNSTSKSGRNSVTGKPFTPFEQAFLNARKAGNKSFEFRGKTYTTKLKSEHLLMSPPAPTGNQSPPGPQDAPGGLYASMTNPPERQPDQPTPDEIAQERVAQGQVPAGGALGLQGPGDPAAAPGPPPSPGLLPDSGGVSPQAQANMNPSPAPPQPMAPNPPPQPGGGGGPNPQFDAELAAFQQRQAAGGPIGGVPPSPGQGQSAMMQLPPGPQPIGGGPGQGQSAGGPIGGPGTAAGYVPPSPGQGQSATMQLPPGPQPIGGGPGQGGADQGGGAIDFQGLARYFYQLGMQAASGGGVGRPGGGSR